MAKRRDEDSALERVFGVLDQAPIGLHDLEPPAPKLPDGLPEPLIELYARCDGGRLFLETLELAASADVESPAPGRWVFAHLGGEAIVLDERGRVWQRDDSLDDDVCEGSRLDRWLAGFVDATDLLYDHDGEFADNVFDEDGEILPEVRERQYRAQLKRDAAAPAPRWRLANELLDGDDVPKARKELELVVEKEPAFAWAWLDLARVSERLGELPNALDEGRMAAETAEAAHHPQVGYFYAQVARLAAKAKDEPARALAAARVSQLAPELKRAQLDGAQALLDDGDLDSARGLVDLLRAVWPKDLEILDLAQRCDRATN